MRLVVWECARERPAKTVIFFCERIGVRALDDDLRISATFPCL